ncbi:hypothetical protein QN092_11740 [Proteus vulgaris]|uniref:hypothetical protein n=1 Tax=Proteus vulgaris TaxID=585 RepID=UPI0025408B89|nr:hypothetical protein [Proteus vulgaris]WIF70666.1 hypothetical protein QN092_11740 [Proteus vulgaris]
MILIGYAILVTLTLLFIFKHKNKFILNEKSLHKQWLFWLAIIAPLVSGIYFGAGIWSEFSLRLDFKGFSNFFDISKFPFGILTLSPILGAFVVSAHRSIQTAKQIEVTEKKNKVDIYYSKRKFINEQLSTITTKDGEKIKRITSLYLRGFKVGNFNDKKTNDLLNNIKESLEYFNKLEIINKGIITTDSYVLCINSPKDNEYINEISLRFSDADNFISNIKNYLYLENKTFIYSNFKECILEYEKLYEDNKSDITNNNFGNDLYLKIKYKYINTYANAIYYIDDIINIIYEIVIILYPDDNINLILPNLIEIKNTLTNCKDELSNLY